MRVEDVKQGSSRYTGELVNSVRDGRGAMTYSNGEVYVGEWRGGRRQGRGVYYYADGTIYDGTWADDKASGEGMCRYPTGNIYKGSWLTGRVSGKGAMYYNDGDAYDGEWKDGRLHGHGRFYNRNGDVHQGKWFEDQILENGSSPVNSVVSERSPRSVKSELGRQKLAIVQQAAFLDNELALLAAPVTLHNLDRLFNIHLAPSTVPPVLEAPVPTRQPPPLRRTPEPAPSSLKETTPPSTPLVALLTPQETPQETPASVAGQYAELIPTYSPESPLSSENLRYSDRFVTPSPQSPSKTEAPLVSSSTDLSSTESLETDDDDDELEEQERLKRIFMRLQREHQRDGVLTRGDLATLARNDPEVSELRHTLRQRSFHGWARVLLDDTSADQKASWGSLVEEREKQRDASRGRRTANPPRSVVIEIPEDDPMPSKTQPVTIGGSAASLGTYALTHGLRSQRMGTDDPEIDRTSAGEQEMKKINTIDTESDSSPEDIEVRNGPDAATVPQWSKMSDKIRLGNEGAETLSAKSTYERLPFGSPDRAKRMEYVVSMCGQAYSPFSFKRFVGFVCTLLFPYPFLPFCPWSLNTRATERNYVVNGATPRWRENPLQHVRAACIIIPLLALSNVFFWTDVYDNKPVVIERSDVIIPLLLFGLHVVLISAYHSHVRKVPHPLETLPHIQYAMFADFSYRRLKSLAGVEDLWVVEWSSSAHGGRFVSHKTNSFRISLVLGLLLSTAIPVHRYLADDVVWGNNAKERVVSITSAVVILLSSVGVYNLILNVIYRQLLLLSQLTALTKLAVIAPDMDVHAHATFRFDLTKAGLAGLNKLSSMSEMDTLLGWCICRSFVLYGSPIMNHRSRSTVWQGIWRDTAQVANIGFFSLLVLSAFLISTFVYDAAVHNHPDNSDRGFTFASAFIVLTSPLLFYQIRLWQRVYRQYREQRVLLSAAIVYKRMQVLSDSDAEIIHEAELIQSLSSFVSSHDYKPRCLGLRISDAPLVFAVFLLLGVSTLVYRWINMAL